ncbi:MAG: hypothetical protein KC476_02530 [Cyanobacteria bacterium HKST-UBA06]|nr:hypothetical protein [Cyanobacteria bacterium HKST-UBA04]MCA9806806.1 hypothetical protein [Cyanobacteria bacterium HKST-UBA06]
MIGATSNVGRIAGPSGTDALTQQSQGQGQGGDDQAIKALLAALLSGGQEGQQDPQAGGGGGLASA